MPLYLAITFFTASEPLAYLKIVDRDLPIWGVTRAMRAGADPAGALVGASKMAAPSTLVAVAPNRQVDGNNSGTPPNPRVLYEDGVHAMQVGNHAQARDIFVQLTHMTPDWSLPWLELGVSQLALDEQTGPAVVALTKAVALNPNNPRAYFYLGTAQRRLEHFELAAAAFKRCVETRPRWLDALMAYGETLDHLNNFAAAIAVYEQVRAQVPTHLGALRRLAELYEQQKDLDRAEACWLAIVGANPSVAYYHYQLGQFYTRIGATKKAKAALEDAAALDPRPPRKMRKLR